MKEYGHFSGKSFIITERETPRHWYNYLYNDEYITFTSQVGFGQGFPQDDRGRRIKAVVDRAVYICDESTFWLANGLPVYEKLDYYHCEHATGYTNIVVEKNGIRTEYLLFVPNVGKRELVRVCVENKTDKEKTLKVIQYVGTDVDTTYNPQGYETDFGGYSEEKDCPYAAGWTWFGGKGTCHSYAYVKTAGKMTGFDTRRSAFLGTYGDKAHPKALMEGLGCTNSDCVAEKLCLAAESTVTLAPGEKTNVYFTVGVETDIADIPSLSGEEIELEFEAMKRKYEELLGGVEIDTPWDDLNHLFNDWLKYQTNMGSRWARVRHNGYRDLTSDTECLSCFRSGLAAERLCRIMSYQYDNGYAPRTFIDGQIKDNNFSDNTVWLTFTTYAITKELGDLDFLRREVPFNNGTSASVYEHIKRSVTFLHGFTGHHGLVKIWGGDWNDCMNLAGIKGQGVSVWLSIAFVRAAKMASEIAGWLGLEEDKATFSAWACEMEERINNYGWKGDRYIYAISDDGTLIGDAASREGSMFALPQLWSVFASFDKEKSVTAMNTLERELNTDLGLLVSAPPYTEQLPYVGAMTRKYPGLHENGGPYLHGAVWKLAVDSLLGRGDKVEEGLHKILPGHHQYFETCGEPYAMFNSYLGIQTGYRAGKPGQSWRTASGQWLLYSIVRFIYGLVPEFEGLRIKPCLPPSWKRCSITKLFRGTKYVVTYTQTGKGVCNTVASVSVNGTPVDPEKPIAPAAGETLYINVVLKD